MLSQRDVLVKQAQYDNLVREAERKRRLRHADEEGMQGERKSPRKVRAVAALVQKFAATR